MPYPKAHPCATSRGAQRQLEDTYLIRLWAEFETAVRSFYDSNHQNPTLHIRAVDLINTVAASRRGRAVASKVLAEVHQVRDYRNSLVHDRDDPVSPVTLGVTLDSGDQAAGWDQRVSHSRVSAVAIRAAIPSR